MAGRGSAIVAVMIAIAVAAIFLRLAGRQIAIAPAGLLSMLPAGRRASGVTIVVAIPIIVAVAAVVIAVAVFGVAIVISIAVAIAIFIFIVVAIFIFVFVFVVVAAAIVVISIAATEKSAATAVPVSPGNGACGRECDSQRQGQEKSHHASLHKSSAGCKLSARNWQANQITFVPAPKRRAS
jgi:hypothetical protein